MLVRDSIHSSTEHDYILQLGRKKLLRQKFCVYAISLKILNKNIYNNISYAWINRVCTLMWRAKPRYNLNMVLLFSCLVVSDSLQPQWKLKSVRLPVIHYLPEFTKLMSIELMMLSNNLILCHIFCLQSFLALGSFPMNQLFSSCGQSVGTSASASVLPMNI